MTESALDLKESGNSEFKKGRYLPAAALYTQAIKALQAQESEDQSLLGVLHSNRAACLLHLNKVNKALVDAQAATSYRPDWEKGHFREGQALEALGKLEEAQEKYKRALECNSQSGEINSRLIAVGKVLRKQKQQTQKAQAQQLSAQAPKA